MKAIIDFADGEVTVRLPFADPGALERAMQSQCGDGATPAEVAETQSKLEWFTHFSAKKKKRIIIMMHVKDTATQTQVAWSTAKGVGVNRLGGE